VRADKLIQRPLAHNTDIPTACFFVAPRGVGGTAKTALEPIGLARARARDEPLAFVDGTPGFFLGQQRALLV
jgi:hypothetical protein